MSGHRIPGAVLAVVDLVGAVYAEGVRRTEPRTQLVGDRGDAVRDRLQNQVVHRGHNHAVGRGRRTRRRRPGSLAIL